MTKFCISSLLFDEVLRLPLLFFVVFLSEEVHPSEGAEVASRWCFFEMLSVCRTRHDLIPRAI